MSFTDGACRQCFIQSLQLKTKHFSFYMQSNLPKCKGLGRVTQGLSPLSRNFSVRMHVKFTCVNEIEAMYERPCVSVKVEPSSPFTLTRERPYIASISFTRLKFLYGNGSRRLQESSHFLPQNLLLAISKSRMHVILFLTLYKFSESNHFLPQNLLLAICKLRIPVFCFDTSYVLR